MLVPQTNVYGQFGINTYVVLGEGLLVPARCILVTETNVYGQFGINTYVVLGEVLLVPALSAKVICRIRTSHRRRISQQKARERIPARCRRVLCLRSGEVEDSHVVRAVVANPLVVANQNPKL